MYGSIGPGTINTGVPISAATLTATGQWSMTAGIVLVLVGVSGILLAVRARRQRDRAFADEPRDGI